MGASIQAILAHRLRLGSPPTREATATAMASMLEAKDEQGLKAVTVSNLLAP
jgi:hypothetical protein